MDQVFSYKKKTLKIEKILKKPLNFVSPEKWEPWSRNGVGFVNRLDKLKFNDIKRTVYPEETISDFQT